MWRIAIACVDAAQVSSTHEVTSCREAYMFSSSGWL